MEPVLLFGLQFTFNVLLYALIARWYVAPRIMKLPLESALIPLLWVHAFRVIGLTILAPGAVDQNIPAELREMIAYGDLSAAVLALLSLLALNKGMKHAIALVWIFNVVGVLDLTAAFIQGVRHSIFDQALGANWLLVTFYVPALWVSSIMIFYLLLKKSSASR